MTKQLTLIARLTAKPETSDDLGNGLRQLIAPTLSEEGAIGYVLHRDKTTPIAGFCMRPGGHRRTSTRISSSPTPRR